MEWKRFNMIAICMIVGVFWIKDEDMRSRSEDENLDTQGLVPRVNNIPIEVLQIFFTPSS